ncbi:MAG: F0F1 ATP synthase subunit B [Pseudomonadota bacterium]
MVRILTVLAAAALTVPAFAADAQAGRLSWWQDTAFWVSVGFILVIVGFGALGVHKTVAKALDERAQKIADELDQARRLREEAQETLAQYQRRQRDAEEEAQAIIDQAKKDARRLAEETRDKINGQIERRIKAAEDKIARAEAQALADVRGQTADLAVETAREIVKARVDKRAHAALVDKAITELRAKLH